jgi:2-polyprenyl-3-methyl-5-hydroxy-6-metoxy-1,4-benzoquinol methylase
VSRYETAIDLDNENNSQTQLITLVGRDRLVLDVGCAAGDTAQALVARGCTVSGVDIDAASAEPAREVLEELVIADIDRSPLSEHFKPESFDAIIFGDVLEHLIDPWSALRDAATLLRPEGRILVSIPNVANAAVRLALLQGNWDYTDKGLLDRTHLRFFTLESFCELLESAGLAIEVLRATVLDPLSVQEISVDAERLPAHIIEWVRLQPEALVYQYVAAARVLGEGEEPGRRPALEPAVGYDAARVQDKHTERWQADLAERHRMLTVRDHVIGLEASTLAADNRTGRMRARAKQAERRFRKARNELEALTGEIEQIATSKRPRTHLRALVERLRAGASNATTDAGDTADDVAEDDDA